MSVARLLVMGLCVLLVLSMAAWRRSWRTMVIDPAHALAAADLRAICALIPLRRHERIIQVDVLSDATIRLTTESQFRLEITGEL